jgi:hypothetical protein
MWEFLKALYEQLGSDYPRSSVVVAAMIGAIVFGGSWWLIGKQYEKEVKADGDRGAFRDLRSTAASPPPLSAGKAGSPLELPKIRKSPSNSIENNDPPPSPVSTPSVETEERKEAEIAAKDSRFSGMTMDEYFEQWYRGAKSSLQRDELEQSMLGRRIIWTGKIKTIESKYSGEIRVIVETDGQTGSAFLDFTKDQRGDLLKLQEGQTIRFTGIIRSFVVSPFLKDCKILKVIN